jgi:hypothetical protein
MITGVTFDGAARSTPVPAIAKNLERACGRKMLDIDAVQRQIRRETK